MANIIYYPNPVIEGRLATIITDEHVSAIIDKGIIPKDAKYVIKPYITNADNIDYVLNLTHSEFLKFNNKKKPTDVVLDVDYIQEYYIERLRELRVDVLNSLDFIQMRALAKRLDDVVTDIEADKELLRNLPSTVKTKHIKTIADFGTILPDEITTDYVAKYKDRIQ